MQKTAKTAMDKPAFRDEVEKRIALCIQEIRDGCVDCGESLCNRHRDFAIDLFLSPRRMLEAYERQRKEQSERIT